MFIIMVVISLLYGNSVFADSEVRGKYRLRSDNGDIRNQYRLDFRYKHEFGSDSCVSLNVRIVTGDTFISDYNTIGDNEKLSLRNVYFYSYVALFSGIAVLMLIYLLAYIKLTKIPCLSAEFNYFLKAFVFGFIWLIQGFILTELKIFLFWIYDNSIMLGASVAIEEGKDPIDDGNA